MRWLIWSIRSAFCKHEWDISEQRVDFYESRHINDEDYLVKNKISISATCKKCGWHRKYWKH